MISLVTRFTRYQVPPSNATSAAPAADKPHIIGGSIVEYSIPSLLPGNETKAGWSEVTKPNLEVLTFEDAPDGENGRR
ncbi:hypothetical protein [Microseira sp. BLCC-F43]|uniref:hypothetical protein n=1 Tax=Microseira sp. BLCC-F43 TaxID=3153602 RepID=UPI0035B7FD59